MTPAARAALWRALAVRTLVAVPLVCFALAVLAWLRYAIDLPWYDDWRGYEGGWIESLDLRRLFTPINYTLSPVGLALDALAQRGLDGNSVGYQLLSMVAVLGALLTLQWRLLMHALRDRLQAAACFTLTLPMLQPGSYWGLENLAYHQALPLVFLGAALWLLVTATAPWRWRGPAVAALALLAGFSYISGAFAGTAAALALVGVIAWSAPAAERGWRLREAAWLVAGALLATAVQFHYSFQASHASAGAVPLAMPWQPAFWWFYLGKVGRALMLPAERPLVAAVLTVAACVGTVALAAAVVRLARQPQAAGARAVAGIFVPLLAAVAVYLVLVAAGRGALRPAGVDQPLAIFAFGFVRFHYFWATLLWPWVAAAVLVLLAPRLERGQVVARTGLVLAAVAVAVLTVAAGGFEHMAHQRGLAADREVKLHCLQQELQKLEAVRCPGLLPPRPGDVVPDARPAYLHGIRIGASFARKILLLPDSPSLRASPKLFDLDGSAGRVEMRHLKRTGAARYEVDVRDSQIDMHPALPDLMRRCTTLEVLAEIRVEEREFVQVFWGVAGSEGPFSEGRSDARVIEPGRLETVSMRLRSPTGFRPLLRFDPVAGGRAFELRSLRVYCVRALD